jgi:FMN phosphatase YigB (HAD superfamily)
MSLALLVGFMSYTIFMIKHIWFDFSDTIAAIDKEKHNALKYGEYAKQKGTVATDDLIAEYDELFERLGRSNSNVFVTTFGLPTSFWPNFIDEYLDIYSLMRPNIPVSIEELAKLVPVSVFSNIETVVVMKNLGINTNLFNHIMSSAELTFPKPHIEGYEKLINMSNLKPEDILYIGDDLKKDILPAKSVGLQVGCMWGKCEEADYEFPDFEDIIKLIKLQS